MLQMNRKNILIPSLITSVFLVGCQHKEEEFVAENQAGSETRLVPTDSAEQLERYIKEGLSRNTFNTINDASDDGQVTAGASVEATFSESTSSTNLQVSGADESDRIKNDGQYLYSIKQGVSTYYNNASSIAIDMIEPLPGSEADPYYTKTAPSILIHQIQADPAASNKLGEITFDESVNNINGLYLTIDDEGQGEQLIAVTNFNPGSNDWYNPWAWQAGQTQLLMYDVTTPNAPSLAHTINIDGHLINSRRVDNTLYLVTRFTTNHPHINTLLEDGRQQITYADLNNISLSELLPQYKINNGETHELMPEKRCFLPEEHSPQYSWPTLTNITAINLDNPEEINSVCYGGHADGFFATPQSIYLTSTSYPYFSGAATDDSIELAANPTVQIPKTSIHKFSLTDNGPTYRGTGIVPGSLMSNGTGPSFLMGENGDVLHIITSWWDQTGINHQLNNLKENKESGMLEIIATLPNENHPAKIGKPGEMIYASRYIGDRAYIVTFQSTDPLYVIDLSNKTQPLIAGELEIPGYSSYLHAVNDKLLLGIGKEAVASSSGPFVWLQGLKISLFDVADINNPQEIKVLSIGERGTHSPALNNHHALTYLRGTAGEPDRFTLPIQLHEGTQSTEEWARHYWQHSGLYLFEIDKSEVADLTHTGTIISQKADNITRWGESIYNDRAVIQKNAVHYIHNNEVLSADWDAVTP